MEPVRCCKTFALTASHASRWLWVARSYNAAYPDILLEADVEVSVIGQVVWVGAELPSRNGKQWVGR